VVSVMVGLCVGAVGPGTGSAEAAPSEARTARSKQPVAARQTPRANRSARASRTPRARANASKRPSGKAVAAAAAAKRSAGAAVTGVVPARLHATAPSSAVEAPEAAPMAIGEAIGLHTIPDRLALRSAVALVVDEKTGEVLYDKSSRTVLPIASITKLMTAMVVLDARQPLDETITILDADRDTERFSASRLPV